MVDSTKTTKLRIVGENEASKAFKTLSKDIQNVSGAVNTLDRNIKLLTAGFISFKTAVQPAFQAIKNEIREIAVTGGLFESLEKRLEAVAGGAEQATESFEFIRQFTRETPLQLNQVADGFIRLKAFGLDPMNGTLQALTDSAIKYTGTTDGMRRVTLAIGQAWAKQKLQGQEILQLTEAGIPVWDLLAEVTGKTGTELQKLSESGKLGRREISLLIKEMGKVSEGAAVSMIQTYNGQLALFKDNIQQARNAVAEAGFLDFLRDGLMALNEEMTRLRETGELEEIASAISDGLVTIGTAAKETIGFIIEFREEIGLLIKFAAGFTLIKLINPLQKLVSVFGLVAGAARTATTVVAAFKTSPLLAADIALTKMGKSARLAAIGMRSLLSATNILFAAWAAFEAFKFFFPELYEELVRETKKVMITIVTLFKKAAIDIEAFWDGFTLRFTSGWETAISEIANSFISLLQTIVQSMAGVSSLLGLEDITEGLSSSIKALEDLKLNTGIEEELAAIRAEAKAAKEELDRLAVGAFIEVDREGEEEKKERTAQAKKKLPTADDIPVFGGTELSKDQLDALADFNEVEKEINKAYLERAQTIAEINLKLEEGLITQANAAKAVESANKKASDALADSVVKGRDLVAVLAGTKQEASMVAILDAATDSMRKFGKMTDIAGISVEQLSRSFSSGMVDAIDQYVSGVKSAGDAMREFAADFLRQIAKMILQQQILNALQAFGGAVGGGASTGAAVAHNGGIIGQNSRTMSVPSFTFGAAPRYHSGGIAGLAPNEVPAVLERGEEVLTRSDPRHRSNGGLQPQGDSGEMKVTINNLLDPAEVLEQAVNTPAGEKTILNQVVKVMRQTQRSR